MSYEHTVLKLNVKLSISIPKIHDEFDIDTTLCTRFGPGFTYIIVRNGMGKKKATDESSAMICRYKCINCGTDASSLYKDYRNGIIKMEYCVNIHIILEIRFLEASKKNPFIIIYRSWCQNFMTVVLYFRKNVSMLVLNYLMHLLWDAL
jgi:hypothetical protein